MLDINFLGFKDEIKYIKRVIFPNYRFSNTNAVHMSSRDLYLDSIVLGESIFKDLSVKVLNKTKPIPVELTLLKSSSDQLAFYTPITPDYEFKDYENLIPELNKSGDIHSRLVFSLTPKFDELSFNWALQKLRVFYADKDRILFGYAMDGSAANDDIPFVVNMFYQPKLSE